MNTAKRFASFSPLYYFLIIAITSIPIILLLNGNSVVALGSIILGASSAGAALIYFKKPNLALYTFILLLPLHSLAITILIARLNVSFSIARAVAGWKEVLLLGMIMAVGVRILARNRISRLVWVDWIAVAWLSLIIIYFLIQDLFLSSGVSLIAKLYGARDWLLYLLPYFAGRFLYSSNKNIKKALQLILLVGVLTSLIGIIDYFFFPVEWHVRLGVPRYYSEFLNQPFPDYLSGLPYNYWAETPVGPVRRAVSTYLSGQGFAIPFLVIFPIAVYNFFGSKYRFLSKYVILTVITMGLILSLTRMTIIACLIQGIVLLWLLRRKRAFINLALVFSLLFLVAIMIVSPFRSYVINTVTFQDTSSASRPGQWVEGLRSLFEHPLGQGLGVTGLTGDRFGYSGFGSEAGYFMITGALGLPGIMLFLLWFTGILSYSLISFVKLEGIQSALGLIVFSIAIGILINNLTAPPNQSPFTVYIFGWLSGIAVQQFVVHPPIFNVERASAGS